MSCLGGVCASSSVYPYPFLKENDTIQSHITRPYNDFKSVIASKTRLGTLFNLIDMDNYNNINVNIIPEENNLIGYIVEIITDNCGIAFNCNTNFNVINSITIYNEVDGKQIPKVVYTKPKSSEINIVRNDEKIQNMVVRLQEQLKSNPNFRIEEFISFINTIMTDYCSKTGGRVSNKRKTKNRKYKHRKTKNRKY